MGRKPSDKPCKGVMIYAETSLVVDVDALCKHLGKNRSDFTRDLWLKEVNQWKNNGADYEPEANLTALEAEEKKLAGDDIAILRKLGGDPSAAYGGLCKLSRGLGLEGDFSNFDSVNLALMNYRFEGNEKFSKSELTLFRNKLVGLRRLSVLHKEILKEYKRRRDKSSTSKAQSEAKLPEKGEPKENLDSETEENDEEDEEEPSILAENEEDEEDEF